MIWMAWSVRRRSHRADSRQRRFIQMSTTIRTWNPMTHADYDTLQGKDVFSIDGDKVGTIRQVFHPNADIAVAKGRHVFLLDPGMFREWFGGMSDVYLPEAAIESVDEAGVHIQYTKD